MKVTDKARVEKIKKFVAGNKVFTLVAILVMILLSCNLLFSKDKTATEDDSSYSSAEQDIEEDLHWQFYWSDLGVLVIGGGFCTFMIIRERKKAREKLK